MTGGVSGRTLLEPGDGSAGPLLRVTDDRLSPGTGYGVHAHRGVDVVAVVLTGSLTHRWRGGTTVAAGDVGVLRAGRGLEHDEVAGPDGARVLQCHLRAAEPGAAPGHEVLRAPRGWVELGRPDARLWLGSPDGEDGPGVPDGVVLPTGGRVVVWSVDPGLPDWAR